MPEPRSGGPTPTVNFFGTRFAVPALYTASGVYAFPDVFSQQFIDYVTSSTVNAPNAAGTGLESIPGYFATSELPHINSDPYAIGLFVDNEIQWDGGERRANVAIARSALNLTGTAVQQRFLQSLSLKYASLGELLNAWGVSTSSPSPDLTASLLSGLSNTTLVFPTNLSQTTQNDLHELLGIYADQYYKVVRDGFKAHLPNKLYLGSRHLDEDAPPTVVTAAARHADVLSMNLYYQSAELATKTWQTYAAFNKPLIVGEFGYIATDRGHFTLRHQIIDTASQADRGIAYQQYMDLIARNPLFVGASVTTTSTTSSPAARATIAT